jgi:CRISPR-associated endoribonuclease Cas6
MTKTMQTKLRAAGLEQHADAVSVRFDTSYAGAKTKLVDIHGIKNRTSVCPVIVEGSPEAVAFAWDVGVGHSTGAGFGALSVGNF